MPKSFATRYEEALKSFQTSVELVLEARGMNKNDLGKAIEAKGLASNKTAYNVLSDEPQPRKLESLAAVAEVLDIPLWILLIPEIPKELLDGEARKQLIATVQHYMACDEEGRREVADTARVFHRRRNPNI